MNDQSIPPEPAGFAGEPLHDYLRHPRVDARQSVGPVKVIDQLDRRAGPDRLPHTSFNNRLALVVTKTVGTMACAYVFALLALISFPAAIASGDPIIIVSWISQSFLQLVLLSIILLGQGLQAGAADKRAESTYLDVEALLDDNRQMQEHLQAQDALITVIYKQVTK